MSRIMNTYPTLSRRKATATATAAVWARVMGSEKTPWRYSSSYSRSSQMPSSDSALNQHHALSRFLHASTIYGPSLVYTGFPLFVVSCEKETGFSCPWSPAQALPRFKGGGKWISTNEMDKMRICWSVVVGTRFRIFRITPENNDSLIFCKHSPALQLIKMCFIIKWKWEQTDRQQKQSAWLSERKQVKKEERKDGRKE